jgi:hypothetical protein
MQPTMRQFLAASADSRQNRWATQDASDAVVSGPAAGPVKAAAAPGDKAAGSGGAGSAAPPGNNADAT